MKLGSAQVQSFEKKCEEFGDLHVRQSNFIARCGICLKETAWETVLSLFTVLIIN